MIDDNPLVILEYLLLVILVLPLVAGIGIGLLGLQSGTLARRLALWTALTHVVLTVMLTMFSMSPLEDRVGLRLPTGEPYSMADDTFHPLFVPGHDYEARGEGTTWTLLTLTPADGYAPAASVRFYIGIDGLNLWLVALTSLMTLIAVLISWERVTQRISGYYAWLFVMQTGIIGAFVSFDILLFYLFFELTLIPAFFLIGSWGVGGARRDAARKFFLYTLLGSLLTLVGIIGLVLTNPTPVNALSGDPIKTLVPVNNEIIKPAAGPVSFSIPQLVYNVRFWATYHNAMEIVSKLDMNRTGRANNAAQELADADPENAELQRELKLAQTLRDAGVQTVAEDVGNRENHRLIQTWLFVALMCGFAVKIPIVPFHTWLPSAYAEAPTAVTMLLSALLAKLGTFGVLRIVLPLCGDAVVNYGLPVFGTLGAIGILYGAFCAYGQRDMKMLTAYSSISHLGLLVIALFAFNSQSLAGASLHMVNHGLATGAMFAMLGFLEHRYRTLDMNQYGGLMGRYPVFAFLFMIVCLASIGLPGLNNFVSEMLMLAGLFDAKVVKANGYWYAAAGVIGIFLSAWYVMTMLRRVLFGPHREPAAPSVPAAGLSLREIVAFGLPALLCLGIGLNPQPILNTMEADIGTMDRFQQFAHDYNRPIIASHLRQ